MKILEEDVLTRAISDEIDSEIETDATATARDVVITVAKFEAAPQQPAEPDECDPDEEENPGEEQDEPEEPEELEPDPIQE
jgi:hypothetical protein